MSVAKKDADYQWLEEVEGKEALDWVRKQNTRTLDKLHAHKDSKTFKAQALEILEAKDKIPDGRIQGEFVYNFWQDAEHVRGILRRTPWEAYKDNKPQWEVLLDVDALAKQEGKSYVFGGADCLRPKFERCLVVLSEGGSDAAQVREFDLTKKAFVKDGFQLPASKSRVEWLDMNTVLLADALEGTPKTDSGYPMQVKIWKRGTPLSAATKVFEGQKADVSVSSLVLHDGKDDHVLMVRADTFFTAEVSVYQDGKIIRLPLPTDVDVKGIFNGQLLFANRSKLAGFGPGSLLTAPLAELLKGKTPISLVYGPTATQALDGVAVGKDYVYVALLDNVRNKVLRFTLDKNKWASQELPLDDKGTIHFRSVDEDSNRLLISYEDFLNPTSLYAMDGSTLKKQLVMQLPARFNAAGLEIRQEFATSTDGVKIPYFLVHRKGLAMNGKNPTLLYAYGGFEVAMQPSYLTVAGKLWLERGGVYVLANIRGGGEFGPTWHQAALKENRQKAFDDFVAVAKSIIAEKVTAPQHLGIQGGSNGGLLMGATFTQHPELFNAVVCQVPLLDMLRFHTLLAGASWMAEYGNPDDPKQAAYIAKYSPFQNLRSDKKYPEVFFMTSTKDDRVHPGHARKMAARMADMDKPFLYYENIEGGHSASANLQQLAERQALSFIYLWDKLGPAPATGKSAAIP
ncbi:prolyl oligopeptidase family serine peptidase [Oligoflexus tunisiensis]|uniref:prolyl oligopeptidase family serine peptidase n=1 Tax=Oligoflexus tunisiensis TaxID=708132 RepID=UPI000A73A68C|nr:prolyl oligopeptidase family serine peptidase [Oligoflexus tunisiensis]